MSSQLTNLKYTRQKQLLVLVLVNEAVRCVLLEYVYRMPRQDSEAVGFSTQNKSRGTHQLQFNRPIPLIT